MKQKKCITLLISIFLWVSTVFSPVPVLAQDSGSSEGDADQEPLDKDEELTEDPKPADGSGQEPVIPVDHMPQEPEENVQAETEPEEDPEIPEDNTESDNSGLIPEGDDPLESGDTQNESAGARITELEAPQEQELHRDEKPELTSFLEELPDTLHAVVITDEAPGGVDEDIPVVWECADPYETDNAVYEFRPVIDENQFLVDTELPCIWLLIGDGVLNQAGGYISPDAAVLPESSVTGHTETADDGSLPAYYSFRASMPQVRNQGEWKTSWSFSALGAVEADMIHDGNADSTVDFSEAQLGYSAAYGYEDPKGNHSGDTVDYAGNDSWINSRGNHFLALNAFSNMIGPVNEEDVSFDPYAVSYGAAQVKGIYLIDPLDRSGIKKAILDHGAVSIAMYAGSFYYNAFNNCYMSNTAEANHTAVVVGWDDHYPRTNFSSWCRPQNDGAWLVRNSWGDQENSLNGYFWLSYEDTGMKQDWVYAFDADRNVYDYCYSYDGTPGRLQCGSDGGNTVTVSQTYAVDAGEAVKAVGIETWSTDLTAEITLSSADNTVSTSAYIDSMGFRVVELPEALLMESGGEVTLTITYTGDNIGLLYEPAGTSGIGDLVFTGAMSGPGYLLNGEQQNADLCMKLYTDTYEVPVYPDTVILDRAELKLTPGESASLKAEVLPDSSFDRTVVWSSDDETVASVDENGTVTGISAGTVKITAASVNGISAVCEVRVIPQVQNIEFAWDSLSLVVGQERSLPVYAVPRDAELPAVTFTSLDPDIAEIRDNRTVFARMSGTVVIAATTEDGFLAECKVTVWPAGIHARDLKTNYIYTGSAIKPEIKVYDGFRLLKAGTDYTISWKNNTRVAASYDAKAPTVVIRGKGNFSAVKELHFNIDPADIAASSVADITLIQSAKPKKLSVSPKVIWNGRTLKSGTDYTVDYNGWNQIDPGEHVVLIHGKGNFTGNKPVNVYVAAPDQVSVTKLAVAPSKIVYTEGMTSQTVLDQVVVKSGRTVLESGTDYVVTDMQDCDHAGTCTFVLTGTGDKYYGKRTVSVKITGKSLSKVTASGKAVFDGSEQTLHNNEITLMNGKVPLTEGIDYEIVSYKNNINAGRASVTIQGINGYTGSKTVTYTIMPDTTEREISLLNGTEVIYEKGGVKPKVFIDGLTEGKDFKVTYRNNTKVAAADMKKAPAAVVSFIGNYKGTPSKTVNFSIVPKDIGTIMILAADPVFANRKGNYKAKLVLTDSNGKNLTAGTDYDKVISYYDSEGNVIVPDAVLNDGDIVRAVVNGKGNYTGTIEVSYRIISKPMDISKAVIRIAAQEYTGSEIIPERPDITEAYLKLSKNDIRSLVLGTDYEIIRCVNNIQKGTATVTFQGINEYGGLKTVNFKILQKSLPGNFNKRTTVPKRIMTSQVPASFDTAAAHEGTVVEMYYPSKDFTTGRNTVKPAYVYLPYGYEEGQQYDVLYMMHGWMMRAQDFLYEPVMIKELFDHLNESGNVRPFIVICLSFDADNEPQSYQRSVEELAAFHYELRYHAMPHLEARLSTYAEDTSLKGLRASRDHRAFAGFSMGAVTTWHQFIYNLDVIRGFVPMSGDCWIRGNSGGMLQPESTVDALTDVIARGGYQMSDYLIYAGIGTNDSMYHQTDIQLQEMMRRQEFSAENLVCGIKKDGYHNMSAVREYLFNALPLLFPADNG